MQIIEKLSAANKNFKYVVNVALVAQGGNGFDMGGMCLYNAEMDGCVSIKFQSKYMSCVTFVYGIAN